MPQTIVVYWVGPYSLDQIKKLDQGSNRNGFYLFVGTLKNTEEQKKRNSKALNYCGMTTRSFSERVSEHEKNGRFNQFEGRVEIWIGNCEQTIHTDLETLRRAESLMIRGWDVPGNIQSRVGFPAPICLVMRWYDKSWQPLKVRPRFMSNLPDVLWLEDKIIWTGKLEVKNA